MKDCLEAEDSARDKLTQDWAKYSSEAKGRCTGMVHRGGPPSYVELISCLELTKGAGNPQVAIERAR